MNENEKRIITVLNQRGPSTRKEISAACGISWAAAVKLVNRLSAQGMIRCLGESTQKTENGKTSRIYDIAELQPLAIGIDIEYGHTTITAQNLKYRLYYSEIAATPQNPTMEEVVVFLAGLVERCRKDLAGRNLWVEGVGVGIPGLLIPSGGPPFDRVADALSRACSLPVVADNNIRAYTLYLQKQSGNGGSFAVFIIRKGIGAGITLGGKLFRGYSGLAGELGHLPIDSEGPRCRCGKRGCVEAYFNQREIARSWAEAAGISRLAGQEEQDERRLVEELFSEAAEGNPRALSLLKEKAAYLVPAIAGLLLSFDIENIMISGHFGPRGEVLIPILNEGLAQAVSSRFHYSLNYRQIKNEGFAIGATMLFLNKYYDYTVLAEH
ncbi:xylose repressor [Spirochaetia bacterium]|nr:xylose repressor [Spirochaetia bacterium]